MYSLKIQENKYDIVSSVIYLKGSSGSKAQTRLEVLSTSSLLRNFAVSARDIWLTEMAG